RRSMTGDWKPQGRKGRKGKNKNSEPLRPLRPCGFSLRSLAPNIRGAVLSAFFETLFRCLAVQPRPEAAELAARFDDLVDGPRALTRVAALRVALLRRVKTRRAVQARVRVAGPRCMQQGWRCVRKGGRGCRRDEGACGRDGGAYGRDVGDVAGTKVRAEG